MDIVFSETTFTNDRQKVEVMVTKQDEDTENPLDGGIFGLYAASDIIMVLGREGVREIIELDLNAEELTELQSSAEDLKSMLTTL